MPDAQPGNDRVETVLVVVLYVVPLILTVAFLAVVGLPGLALALLAVEAFMTAAVVVAKRPDGSPRRPGPAVTTLVLVGSAAAVAAVPLLA